jgi:UDP-N-acetylmuramoylalanine--D-glutamate ligase
MPEGKSYTIHKSKTSPVNRDLTARESLKRALEKTAHRMDSVRTVGGVEFINDARSTDLLSTRDSMKCIMKPAIWLAATTPHERDYALIEMYVKYKIKAIVVYGAEGHDMHAKLEHLVDDFVNADHLQKAVLLCYEIAEQNDLVIYSPSCLPNDEYKNFFDRGIAFREFVNQLDG